MKLSFLQAQCPDHAWEGEVLHNHLAGWIETDWTEPNGNGLHCAEGSRVRLHPSHPAVLANGGLPHARKDNDKLASLWFTKLVMSREDHTSAGLSSQRESQKTVTLTYFLSGEPWREEQKSVFTKQKAEKTLFHLRIWQINESDK